MSEAVDTIPSMAPLPAARTTCIDRGRGPALVMVHGVGLNAAVWMPQLDAFAADHRVLAYDTLGHGGSALPSWDAELPDYVAQVNAVLDEAGVAEAILMGHSMGALIAIRAALDLGCRVRAVVAVNPVYRRPASQLAASRERARELEHHGCDSTLEQALRRWFGDDGERSEARVEQVRRWLRDADPVGYARAYRVFCEADPWLDGCLGELRIPALFVTGGLDPNSTPAMARAMAAEAPRAEAVVVEGERHMLAFNAPDRFNAVVRDFLDRLHRSGANARHLGRREDA